MGWVDDGSLLIPSGLGSARYLVSNVPAITSAAGAGVKKSSQIGRVRLPKGVASITVQYIYYLAGTVVADAAAKLRTSIQGKSASAFAPDGVILDAGAGSANAFSDDALPASSTWTMVDLGAANAPTLTAGQMVAIVHEIDPDNVGTTGSVIIQTYSMAGFAGKEGTTGFSDPNWTNVASAPPNVMISDGTTYGYVGPLVPGQSFTTTVYNSSTAVTRMATVFTNTGADKLLRGCRLGFSSLNAAAEFNAVLRDSAGAQIGSNVESFAAATFGTVSQPFPAFEFPDGLYLWRRGETIMISVDATAANDITIGAVKYPNATIQAMASLGVNVGLRTYTSGAWGTVDTLSRTVWSLIVAEEFIPSKGKGMSKMDLVNPLTSTDFPTETASFTDTAGSTDPWTAGPEGVLVWADQDCYVAVGEGAVATANNTPIPAYTPVPFKVPQGTGAPWRVSALQISTSGTVYAKPINAK